MTTEIKHRSTGAVLYAHECPDSDQQPTRTAVEAAVRAGANLADADLTRAKEAE